MPRGGRSGGENDLTKATTVCIVGVGLIGGSLGQALRQVRSGGKRRYKIIGLGRHRAELMKAKRLGAVDLFSTDAKTALAEADIVVFCVPVHRIVPLIKKHLPLFKTDAILTDVGSVKQSIVAGMQGTLSKRRDLRFVGAHPIAGSEKTGVENATPALFKKATCVITNDLAPFHALESVRSFWVSIGARCLLMSAAEHDRWLALTSHLPHLLAFSLFSEVSKAAETSPVQHLVAGSFRDMTRIAGADADLWAGIITNNRTSIKKAAAGLIKQLHFFSNATPAKLQRALTQIARTKSDW